MRLKTGVILFMILSCSFIGCGIAPDPIIVPDDPIVAPEVTLAISGDGLVSIEPESFEAGDTITLTADAGDGWVFEAWDGDVQGNRETMQIQVTEDLVVEASFIAIMENVIRNPRFEDETMDPWGITESGSGTTLERITYDKHVGQYAAKISNRTETWNRLRQIRSASNFATGQLYFFSAWLKHGEGEALARIQFDEKDIGIEGMINSQEWTRITGVYQLPDDISSWPIFQIRVNSTEDFYVDDVLMAQIVPDVLDVTTIDIIGTDILSPDSSYVFTAIPKNAHDTTVGVEDETVTWSLVNPTAGVSIDQNGELVVGQDVPNGTEVIVRATLDSNPQIYEDMTVTIDDISPELLANLVRSTTVWSDLLETDLRVRIFHKGESASNSVYEGILYVQNPGFERVGLESDNSILTDYLNEGLTVITVDYQGDARAVSPGLEEEVHSFFDPRANNTSHRRIREQLFSGISNYRPQRTYVLPPGYRVARGVVYFDIAKHGPYGTMEFLVDQWNNEISDHYDVDPITDPSELRTGQGNPIRTTYFMDVIYPSQVDDPVPVMVRFATDRPTDPNAGINRWHFTGFTMRGYAFALVEHTYNPLYGSYWRAIGYSLVSYLGLDAATSAIRHLRANENIYNIDGNNIFAHGHSKGAYYVTRLLNPDHPQQTEFRAFDGFPEGSPEPQLYQGYSSQIKAGYQSMGLGTFFHDRYDHAGNRVVTANYLPTLIAHGENDDHLSQFYQFVARLEHLNVEHESLFMPGIGHEVPYGWNPEREMDNYQIYVDFFTGYYNGPLQLR